VHNQYSEGSAQMFQAHGTSKTPIIKKYMDKPKQVHTVASPTAGCGTNEAWKILIDLAIKQTISVLETCLAKRRHATPN
jgi:hypothetical protein